MEPWQYTLMTEKYHRIQDQLARSEARGESLFHQDSTQVVKRAEDSQCLSNIWSSRQPLLFGKRSQYDSFDSTIVCKKAKAQM